MGFFSSILGGSKGGSSSGFNAWPKEAKADAKELTAQASTGLLGPAGAAQYTPLAQTDAETQAYQQAQQPTTAAGVGQIASTYMNPYTSYITDQINQQAQGDYSLTKQALANSGQMGSNREYIQADAADKTRLNAIQGALSGEYNTALQTGLGQNQQNINNLLTEGANQRTIDTGTKTAGTTALTQLADILSGLYSGSGTQKTSSSNGIGSLFGSDRRLKENIHWVGIENGQKIYRFNYKGGESEYIGVMADEVPEDARIMIDGFYAVDYGKIGVQFRKVQ